ncbi:MAG: DNA-processing protein DprA [Patescibacteria group bacterium]
MSKYVDIQSEDYPCLLKEIRDPPKRLYYKGNFNTELFDNCVSVVGSRVISDSGRKIIKHLFSTMSKSITIVSGFMSGVDAGAHMQALEFGLKTIAVMPCGIDYIHPENQTDLYNEIICNNGLVVSEFDCDLKPEVWTYPRRNRIVAGMGKATIIIEASLNSGSLITARLADCYGRKVFIPSLSESFSDGVILLGKEFAEEIESGLQVNEYLELFNEKHRKRDSSAEQQLGIF